MKRCSLLFAVLSLAGCAASTAPPYYRTEAFWLELKRLDEECNARFTTALDRAECVGEPTRDATVRAGYAYMDLVDLLSAYNVVLGRRVDAGDISNQRHASGNTSTVAVHPR
jgi:hypothetical protein